MMLGMEEILCELERDEMNEQGLPPGFRFHPTDEELITFYLASKVFSGTFSGVQIAEVDLNRCEPWELPDVAKMGEREWYFFSLRDRKYPTGLRTNRATGAGYWKATGKDRQVHSSGGSGALLGMKKTLVFYKGRAPRGEKTKWVMHEYRLDGDFSCRHTAKEEWVICRIFHKMGEKKTPNMLETEQNYSIKTSPFPTNSLPPLLEPPPIMQTLNQAINQNPNNFLINQESNDIKSLINPLIVSQNDHLFPLNNKNNAASLFKPDLVSQHQQDFTLKELSNAIARQYCKKEPGFGTHYQSMSGDGFGSMSMQENGKCENPFDHLFGSSGHHEIMGSIIPSSAGTVDHHNINASTALDAATDYVMSIEPTFGYWW